VDAILRNDLPFFLLPAALLLAAAELGFRLGRRPSRTGPPEATDHIGGIQAGVLGLLGLLLGFTFSMAAGRYEMRRDLVVKEANAIGTTFLRAALLPDAHRAPVEALLRRYVDLRLALQPRTGDPAQLADGLRRSAAIQQDLWQHAVAASKESPTPIVAAFVATLNDTIDTEAERVAAGRNRIPPTVWVLLLGVASLGCVTSSYIFGRDGVRSPFSNVVFPLLVAVVVALIFDLADPQSGFIRIPQQPLVDLRQSMGQ